MKTNREELDRAANAMRHEMLRVRAAQEASGAGLLCADCDAPAQERSCYCERCERLIYGAEVE